MNKSKIFFWIVVAIILLLPFLNNAVYIPHSFAPYEIARFVGSYIRYYLELLKNLKQEVMS